MLQTVAAETNTFVDRRQASGTRPEGSGERRQFINARPAGRPEVQELAEAVDQYQTATSPPVHHLRGAVRRHGILGIPQIAPQQDGPPHWAGAGQMSPPDRWDSFVPFRAPGSFVPATGRSNPLPRPVPVVDRDNGVRGHPSGSRAHLRPTAARRRGDGPAAKPLLLPRLRQIQWE